MLSFVYTLIKYTLGHKPSIKNETDEIDNAVARIENAHQEEVQENEYSNDRDCYYKTGNITFMSANYAIVDHSYMYDMLNVSVNNLKIGDKVHYLIKQDDEYKIKKIIPMTDDSWDDAITPLQISNNEPKTLLKCIIGKVIERKNRLVIVEPNNVCVDLNKVQAEFIPVIGDWLKLESEVEISEDSYDPNETILKIKKIQPLRSKLDIGTVSTYDPVRGIGTIGKDIVFNRRICDSGYIPCIGDKVVSDNIESDQGVYTWRSLTVVPVCKTLNKETKLLPLQNILNTKSKLDDLVKNKYGITISNDLSIELNMFEEKELIVTVQNVGNTTHVLQKGYFMTKRTQSQLVLVQPTTLNATSVLNPSDELTYIFKCTAKFIGTSDELFIFNFKDFEIGRTFHITVRPKTIQNKKCFKDENNEAKNSDRIIDPDEWSQTTYIPGIRPYQPPRFIKLRNTIFRVPRHYWNIVSKCMKERKSQTECEYDIENAIPCLKKRLSFKDYRDRFHALLYLEEIAQTIDMYQYNLDSTTMRRSGEYLVMQVPGLAEKRPSLLVGDRAIVSFKWDDSEGKIKYEGCIHKVTSSDIFLKFNYNFHQKYNYEDCQVIFKCSHAAIQRCHNAVNMAVHRLGQSFLFPTCVIEKESQVDLREFETTEKPDFKQMTHQRTDSVSSESSSSITSTSNKSSSTSKSSTKVSVVQRLFNVKPMVKSDEYTESKVNPINPTQLATDNQDVEIEKTIDIDKTSPSSSNETPSSHSNELQSYVTQIKKRKLVWFNKNLNYYQKEAVKNILKGHARPLPYVIFGPPGTGKTVTLCETILQILSILPESRLLVATPSNSSANLIAERLLDSGVLKPGDMVRLIAHHCLGNDSIPSKLLPYCATAELANEATIGKLKYSGEGPKLSCTMSVLGRHRITVGTCIALAVLNNMGFPRGHFSHILVDEAGQATEPEIMIPLNFVHSDYGQVILAGDPLQLGPVVQSKLAKSFGLDESFLTRLLRYFPYQKDPNGFDTLYDRRLVTKLAINYRSLPQILELASSLFYDSELIAYLSPKKSKEAKLLQRLADELPGGKDSPLSIIFHGVNGENCKDNDSPSWYNPAEATQAYLYLLKLYKCGLTPDDIGIITPYQKQVFQIRELLMELNMDLPKISSVEGFQGQERNVIIISAVRSSTNFINDDIKHSLGFVACPRRLNVAITRARVLVIILGNPYLLAQDPYWRSVLIYCINQDAYVGCNFSLSDMEDVLTEINDCATD